MEQKYQANHDQIAPKVFDESHRFVNLFFFEIYEILLILFCFIEVYLFSMKKIIFIILTILQSVASSAQSKSFDVLLRSMIKKTVPIIKVDELESKKNEVVLLDARELNEYEVSHLKNARHVGFNNFSLESVKDIPKTAPIVVYCSIGVRSEKIGEKLVAAGYSNVRNCYGSIFEWVNQGNEVVDMQDKPTKKIHAYNKKWGVWVNKGEKVY
jgi:rhodanese-related sulfurtransferase